MLGILLLAGTVELFTFRDGDKNLQKVADAIDADKKRQEERQKMRVFLAERNLQTTDDVLARMGL